MFILSDFPSIGNHFLQELRSLEIQKDSMRFRKNMERLGEILAYEISKTLPFRNTQTKTPLGISEGKEIDETIVLATILRAGLPFHQGFLNYFDKAENAFVASYRNHDAKGNLIDIKTEYISSPSLEGKTLILADPMLATGQSLLAAYVTLLQKGRPSKVYIASIIASRAGVSFIKKHLPDAEIWLGTLDEELNSKSYIIPGLGDAGDLAFGIKV